MSENKEQYKIEYTTLSGFDLEITPLPPYYSDLIEDLYPLKDYPKRIIELMAGDVYEEPYEPSPEMPAQDDEEYPLWIRWYSVEEYNDKVTEKVGRAKRDMLLSLCVNIVGGPIDVNDDGWLLNLEAPFVKDELKFSKHEGFRKLIFLKYIILTSSNELNTIIQVAMFPEVTEQGIGRALLGFRDIMGPGTVDRDYVKGQEEASSEV